MGDPITKARIDELLCFLPLLSGPSSETEPAWRGLDQNPAGGTFVMPYPIYPPAVTEFFSLAARECWCDFEYVPDEAGELVRDDTAIAVASLAQIKTMLTFCVRGERFCDGHWGGNGPRGPDRRHSSAPRPTAGRGLGSSGGCCAGSGRVARSGPFNGKRWR